MGITQRARNENACGVHLTGHNISVVFYDRPEFYNWTSQQWISADNINMKFLGRGYGCAFYETASEAYVILAGGDQGRNTSQILDVKAFLATGDKNSLVDATEGPDLPAVMIDSAQAILDNGSLLMVGSRTSKSVHVLKN